jgi:hypothetical protein
VPVPGGARVGDLAGSGVQSSGQAGTLRGIVVSLPSGQHNVFNGPVRPHGNGSTTQGIIVTFSA